MRAWALSLAWLRARWAYPRNFRSLVAQRLALPALGRLLAHACQGAGSGGGGGGGGGAAGGAARQPAASGSSPKQGGGSSGDGGHGVAAAAAAAAMRRRPRVSFMALDVDSEETLNGWRAKLCLGEQEAPEGGAAAAEGADGGGQQQQQQQQQRTASLHIDHTLRAVTFESGAPQRVMLQPIVVTPSAVRRCVAASRSLAALQEEPWHLEFEGGREQLRDFAQAAPAARVLILAMNGRFEHTGACLCEDCRMARQCDAAPEDSHQDDPWLASQAEEGKWTVVDGESCFDCFA